MNHVDPSGLFLFVGPSVAVGSTSLRTTSINSTRFGGRIEYDRQVIVTGKIAQQSLTEMVVQYQLSFAHVLAPLALNTFLFMHYLSRLLTAPSPELMTWAKSQSLPVKTLTEIQNQQEPNYRYFAHGSTTKKWIGNQVRMPKRDPDSIQPDFGDGFYAFVANEEGIYRDTVLWSERNKVSQGIMAWVLY